MSCWAHCAAFSGVFTPLYREEAEGLPNPQGLSQQNQATRAFCSPECERMRMIRHERGSRRVSLSEVKTQRRAGSLDNRPAVAMSPTKRHSPARGVCSSQNPGRACDTATLKERGPAQSRAGGPRGGSRGHRGRAGEGLLGRGELAGASGSRKQVPTACNFVEKTKVEVNKKCTFMTKN